TPPSRKTRRCVRSPPDRNRSAFRHREPRSPRGSFRFRSNRASGGSNRSGPRLTGRVGALYPPRCCHAPGGSAHFPAAPTAVGMTPEERMKIRPLHDRVIVKRVEEEEKPKDGIIIPETAKEKPLEGKVIA